jgi:hypothetical protein
MARLYSNENFPLRAVQELRACGHDVLTSLEAGRANQKIPDDEVLRYATGQQRAVLTLNRLDFFRLHRDVVGRHTGIIACTRDADSAALARRIHEAIEAAGKLDGQLIRIVRPPL